MAILRSVRQSFVVGLAAGVAVGVALSKPGQPGVRAVAKTAMKGAMSAFKKGQLRIAQAREAISDIAAEASHEHTSERSRRENGAADDKRG
jgi:hypothetical protein